MCREIHHWHGYFSQVVGKQQKEGTGEGATVQGITLESKGRERKILKGRNYTYREPINTKGNLYTAYNIWYCNRAHRSLARANNCFYSKPRGMNPGEARAEHMLTFVELSVFVRKLSRRPPHGGVSPVLWQGKQWIFFVFQDFITQNSGKILVPDPSSQLTLKYRLCSSINFGSEMSITDLRKIQSPAQTENNQFYVPVWGCWRKTTAV